MLKRRPDRIMISGKTNVTSNTVLAGHVDNFKSQMAEVPKVTIKVFKWKWF